jgi:4'-phosphopantetheinyl transferase
MVEVFATRLMPEEDFLKVNEQVIKTLPGPIQKKILEYVRWQDAQRSLLGEVLIRSLLSGRLNVPVHLLDIRYGEKGKPCLPGDPVHFNLSHSGDWVVAALASAPVGIDVERIKPNKLKIARRFFTDNEFDSIMEKPEEHRLDHFFELWTMKESYLKAVGKGLTQSLSSFSVISKSGEYKLENNGNFAGVNFRSYSLGHGYKLAVCAMEDLFAESVVFLNGSEIIHYQ